MAKKKKKKKKVNNTEHKMKLKIAHPGYLYLCRKYVLSLLAR